MNAAESTAPTGRWSGCGNLCNQDLTPTESMMVIEDHFCGRRWNLSFRFCRDQIEFVGLPSPSGQPAKFSSTRQVAECGLSNGSFDALLGSSDTLGGRLIFYSFSRSPSAARGAFDTHPESASK